MPTPSELIAPADLALDQVVAYWADRDPNGCAIEFPGSQQRTTWGQFESFIRGVAAALPPALSTGDTAAVVCDDSLALHVLVNALWRRRIGVLLLDRSWGTALVTDLLALTGASATFVSHTFGSGPLGEHATLPYPELRAGTMAAGQTDQRLDDIALYATTSGTTDNPKCVAISHRRIRYAYRTCFSVRDFRHVRKTAVLFQVNGLGILGVGFLLPREIGAATVVWPSFMMANVRHTWTSILQSDINFAYLVPPLVRLLNALPAWTSPRDRLLALCAAAPVREREIRSFEAKYPVEVFNAYGLTELTFAVFFGCRADDGGASESIGEPIGLEARLEDDDGHVLRGPARGELLLRGPMLTDGYLNNPAETTRVWHDGWFHTGDIAERDDRGRYFIRGRKKETVLRGGYTYYVHELEHYVRRAPDVIDACAFRGRELPSGDELCVAVLAGPKTTADALRDWIRVQVGASKVPDIIFMRHDDFPRNSNGKILRHVLREQCLGGATDSSKSAQPSSRD